MSEIVRTATVSLCSRYRYRLRREWGQGSAMLFVMLNPSTADAFQDDPTIRKCIGFARRAGHSAIEVVNLFAYRATDPRELVRASMFHDVIGPDNDTAIGEAAAISKQVVIAWGALTGMPSFAKRRSQDVIDLLRPRTVYALGWTKNDRPRHPLYVSYESAFEEAI